MEIFAEYLTTNHSANRQFLKDLKTTVL